MGTCGFLQYGLEEVTTGRETLVLVVGLEGSQELSITDARDVALLATRLVTDDCQKEAGKEQ